VDVFVVTVVYVKFLVLFIIVFIHVQQFVVPQKKYIVNRFVPLKYVLHHVDHHVDLQKEYVHLFVAQKEFVVLQ
jgi:hypothetical protein